MAGAIALGGIAVLHGYAHPLYHGLISGDGLPALIASALAGTATLGLVWLRRYEPARFTAAVAVSAIVAGWALAQSPRLLPGLTVHQAAAPHDTLVAVLVAILAGGALLAPGLVNVADAEWAHVIGAACFLGFIASAFRVAVPLP